MQYDFEKAILSVNQIGKSIAQVTAAVRMPSNIIDNVALPKFQQADNILRGVGKAFNSIEVHTQHMANVLEKNQALASSIQKLQSFYSFQLPRVGSAFENAMNNLTPIFELMIVWKEDENTAKKIIDVGLIPHPVLFDYFQDDLIVNDKAAEQVIFENWTEIKSMLQINLEHSFNDEKLLSTFNQMLDAHMNDSYELVTAALPFITERSHRLAISGKRIKDIRRWLKKAEELPIDCLGFRGYKTWEIANDHLLADARSDEQANSFAYPSRHVSAHGVGSKLADSIDSLNTILLSHFVINYAYSYYQHYKENEAA